MNVSPSVLKDERFLTRAFLSALNAASVTILDHVRHKFSGEGGVTGLFLLSESHASYHSYPEFGYIAVDIFTCGKCDPQRVLSTIAALLDVGNSNAVMLLRGARLNAGATCQLS
jgi:S-adenosylmethionine decarboxylase